MTRESYFEANGLQIEITEQGLWQIMRLTGELDVTTTAIFRDSIEVVLESGNQHLVFDLTDVEFLDSTAFGMIVATYKIINESQGDTRIVCPKGRVRRAFEITGMERLFIIKDTLEEVLAT